LGTVSRSTPRNITSLFPAALGHGGSAKPSDGLKRNFRNTITPTWWTLNTGSCPKDLDAAADDAGDHPQRS